MTVPSMSGTTLTVGSDVIQFEVDHGSVTIWLGFTTEIPDAPLITPTDIDLHTDLPEMAAVTKLPKLETITMVPVVVTHTTIPSLDVVTFLEEEHD